MLATQNITFNARFTLLILLGLLMNVACTDTQFSDESMASHKSYADDSPWDDHSVWNEDSAWDDDSSWNESISPWDDRSSVDPSDQETSDHQLEATHHTQGATAGGYCAPGCIWSPYAVQMGAQSNEASCNGQACACVVQGDIWSSCSSENGSNTNNNNSNSNSNSNSSSSNSNNSNSNAPSGSYNSAVGNRLADEAYRTASWRGTTGYCYTAVADVIDLVIGRFLWGSSAYMAANQLASHPRFTEVSVSDLRSLPAGAVVVWSRGTSAHGHISIALGDGREASDHIARQMLSHYGGGYARIFYPN